MKSNFWTWIIGIVGVILLILLVRYLIKRSETNSVTSRQRPVITSCPKGYVLHKGHCVWIGASEG